MKWRIFASSVSGGTYPLGVYKADTVEDAKAQGKAYFEDLIKDQPIMKTLEWVYLASEVEG